MDRFTVSILKDIRKYHMLPEGCAVQTGFSGGADSTCLLQLLFELKSVLRLSTLEAVHVNHGLRGEEADQDEEFCRHFCEERGIRFHAVKIDVPDYVNKTGASVEEGARILRYKVFSDMRKSLARELGTEPAMVRTATAHHAGDQAETILLNLFRGSALKGLTGMRPVRDGIVRPLLYTEKEAILSWLEEKKISFVTDSSNLCTDYTRNYLRCNVIPGIGEKVNSKAMSHVAASGEYIHMADAFLTQEALRRLGTVMKGAGMPDILTDSAGTRWVSADRKALAEQPGILRLYMYRALLGSLDISMKDWSSVHFEDMDRALQHGNGFHLDLPGGAVVENRGRDVCFIKTGSDQKRKHDTERKNNENPQD